ncbi:uncharacterized protein [Miscanthus floridulus]|uniref:uncharacterized protein n=1 Tax=Miscanthus floridulus TaxID=154761 RepID=UPI00345A4166
MEREFQQGDLVYMKLQPYVQSTLAARSNKKLPFQFYGPYKVLQRVGKVAYKLELPEGSRIHPVIHVSQLKKHIPKDVAVTKDLTSVSTDPFQVQLPMKILQTQVIQGGANMINQVLVQWSSVPEEMATWEDEADVPCD